MIYYKEISFWYLNGERLNVAEDNEHLGLIVSGSDEERKNVDKKIKAARNSMFSLLGPAFSFKCKLSPTAQTHLWRVYVKPVLTSGLAALPVRPSVVKTLTSFHHKTLRGFLKLSNFSPIAPLYFLLGELPIEATLHLDVLSLFWNIWANPQTKIHKIVKYILKMTDNSSVTWSAHVRLISQIYGLPDPLSLIEGELWTKLKWKEYCHCKIRSFYEKLWRAKAAKNDKLIFLNVQVTGLNGHHHPALHSLTTTQIAFKARPQLKILSGDYPCYAIIARDRGSDPKCRLCPSPAPPETITHVLTQCCGTREVRNRIWPELLNTIATNFPSNLMLSEEKATHTATQFVLDCTSLNLRNGYRIEICHPAAAHVFSITRQFCYAVHMERSRKLKKLGHVR